MTSCVSVSMSGVWLMSERDRRYDGSRKGKRRRKRYESSAARRAYRARWMREYRQRRREG